LEAHSIKIEWSDRYDRIDSRRSKDYGSLVVIKITIQGPDFKKLSFRKTEDFVKSLSGSNAGIKFSMSEVSYGRSTDNGRNVRIETRVTAAAPRYILGHDSHVELVQDVYPKLFKDIDSHLTEDIDDSMVRVLYEDRTKWVNHIAPQVADYFTKKAEEETNYRERLGTLRKEVMLYRNTLTEEQEESVFENLAQESPHLDAETLKAIRKLYRKRFIELSDWPRMGISYFSEAEVKDAVEAELPSD
jgi:hypothetical protein